MKKIIILFLITCFYSFSFINNPFLFIDKDNNAHIFYTINYLDEESNNFTLVYANEFISNNGKHIFSDKNVEYKPGYEKTLKFNTRSILFDKDNLKTIFLQNFQLLSPGIFRSHSIENFIGLPNYYVDKKNMLEGIVPTNNDGYKDFFKISEKSPTLIEVNYSRNYTNSKLFSSNYYFDYYDRDKNEIYKKFSLINAKGILSDSNISFLTNKNHTAYLLTRDKNNNISYLQLFNDFRKDNNTATASLTKDKENIYAAFYSKNNPNVIKLFTISENDKSDLFISSTYDYIIPNSEKIINVSDIKLKVFPLKIENSEYLAVTGLSRESYNNHPVIILLKKGDPNFIVTKQVYASSGVYDVDVDKNNDLYIAYLNRTGDGFNLSKAYIKDLLKSEVQYIFGSEQEALYKDYNKTMRNSIFQSINNIENKFLDNFDININAQTNPNKLISSLLNLNISTPFIKKDFTLGASINLGISYPVKYISIGPYIKYNYNFYTLKSEVLYMLTMGTSELNHSGDEYKYNKFGHGLFLRTLHEFKANNKLLNVGIELELSSYIGSFLNKQFINKYGSSMLIMNSYNNLNVIGIKPKMYFNILKKADFVITPGIYYYHHIIKNKYKKIITIHELQPQIEIFSKIKANDKIDVSIKGKYKYNVFKNNHDVSLNVGIEF